MTPCVSQPAAAALTWTSLIGPAVVAAIIVAAMTERRLRVDIKIAERRFALDRELAELKLMFDKQLAEHKAKLDADLAERKATFDRELAVWRRRFDIAEQFLAAAYEARDALKWARGRGIFSGEGQTRIATEPESQAIKEARDAAYVPLERLQSHSKAFATLQTLQDAILAHFGKEAAQPIYDIFAVHRSITRAAAHLIQNAAWNENRDERRLLQPFRDELWGDNAEASNDKLDAAIQQLDAICKPILSGQAPT